MEKKHEILEARKRLDNSLCSPDLVNEDSIASLIKEHLLPSYLRSNSDVGTIVQSRTKEVANFLEMLRSASGSAGSHLKFSKDWKVKQDTDQLRVMYCEGPHGSPFHTLLAEGFADGPMDVCLCVSWELTLYKKWWPQYTIPTFKVIASSCLQKVRIGEEISLIRMKVPWPISDREAVLHYFEIEFFKEDLVLILIKTLSDTEHVDADTHGFCRDGIPQAKDTIRIDLVGGVVLQRVETNRCYFRAIFDFDIKLDLIPPSLINFISRQLVGNGHKLFQKAVGCVAATDADYREALQGPLYSRIRHQLHSHNGPATSFEDFEKEELEEHTADAVVKNNISEARTSVPEITEEDELRRPDTTGKNTANGSSENMVLNEHRASSKEKPSISPEVEHALEVLDQAITIVKRKNCNNSSLIDGFSVLPSNGNLFKNGNAPESSNNRESTDKSAVSSESTSKSAVSRPTEDHSQRIMSSSTFDSHHDEAKLSSKIEGISDLESSQLGTKTILPSKAYVRVVQPPVLDSHGFSKVCDEESLKANGFYSSGRPFNGKTKKKKRKKLILCCLSPSFFRPDINKDRIE